MKNLKIIFSKTFGGLERSYYLRQLFFGSLLPCGLIYFLSGYDSFNEFLTLKAYIFFVISTILYPFSRFAFESILDFIFGENVFFVDGAIREMERNNHPEQPGEMVKNHFSNDGIRSTN